MRLVAMLAGFVVTISALHKKVTKAIRNDFECIAVALTRSEEVTAAAVAVYTSIGVDWKVMEVALTTAQDSAAAAAA